MMIPEELMKVIRKSAECDAYIEVFNMFRKAGKPVPKHILEGMERNAEYYNKTFELSQRLKKELGL